MRHDPSLHPATHTAISRSELLGAFSYALDMTEGQPAGHSLRCSYIALRLADLLGLEREERAELRYAVLLKDLGCSSNSARIAELYLTDDRAFKQSWKTIAPGLPATLRFVFEQTGREASLGRRISAVKHILTHGDDVAQEMIESRCTRGAAIARDLRFPEVVATAIFHLDERWDGSGRPDRLASDAIPLYSRIALLAQVVDVFYRQGGKEAACFEISRRSGSWFDPRLAATFARLAEEPGFWINLSSPFLEAKLAGEADDAQEPVDEDYLDAVAAAFGKVIDAKSPFTSGHSERVADYAERMASGMGLVPSRVRQLRRAAALHDVGKLGVSSTILEKPGRLDAEEWSEMRDHAVHTHAILSHIGAFSEMARIAASHHEKLDGTGYPLGLADQNIVRETRIITTCDFYDALTADRPYRAAMPQEKALAIIGSEVGTALDAECFEMLKQIVCD
ncbi:HD domain-containing protein [Altererythrobacter aurantiacus]|uniref:HD domain-containing protein n=1 Tax=Parapontixanthobacter aurantiacus TaxID=1463599 RepID=A0A844ZHW3_9SPHN|nr:HD domain-containing protein [Parapontixanthobacter aurantiacus]MXO86716.1 HD domain-containing protein [Parapontixanthobacter aurantiacus]